jgi:Protein of unknown function (DUF3887)
VSETPVADAAERARTLFSDVAAGDWSGARAGFSETMNRELDNDGLARAWAQVAAQVGDYRGMGEPVVAQAGDLTNVTVPLEFDASEMQGCVSFDRHGRVAGLHFLFGLNSPGGNATGNLVLRCSDGHLYTASRSALLWHSVHIGTQQFRPCPVDGKWRVAVFVEPAELSQAELEQAKRYSI